MKMINQIVFKTSNYMDMYNLKVRICLYNGKYIF